MDAEKESGAEGEAKWEWDVAALNETARITSEPGFKGCLPNFVWMHKQTSLWFEFEMNCTSIIMKPFIRCCFERLKEQTMTHWERALHWFPDSKIHFRSQTIYISIMNAATTAKTLLPHLLASHQRRQMFSSHINNAWLKIISGILQLNDKRLWNRSKPNEISVRIQLKI